MTPHEVQRALRMITSPTWRRTKRFPITVIANMSGLSRMTLYQARNGNRLTKHVVTVLSPILTDILAGKLKARWKAGYTLDVTRGQMEERQFSPAGQRLLRFQERELEWTL